jgi:NAD-dependent SIR2 family protein deacetylase
MDGMLKVRQANDHAQNVASVETDRCQIVDVGKRRDGGTRYWCLKHRADATAKYGKRARACRAAHVRPETTDAFELDLDVYRGAVALWGAVPAVYDTTRLPLDQGIHVHARRSALDKKEIDGTFPRVKLRRADLPASGVEVVALDAIYYMVSSVFGFGMRQVLCTHCGEAHLDRDWFSVHPHNRHLCAACGRTFSDSKRGVGNPIVGVRQALGVKAHKTKRAKRRLTILQEEFPGGIQVWGSNPALVWTGNAAEEEGIHIHAFKDLTEEPDIDDTYSHVTIDGIELNPLMVRVLMAQNTLPHLRGRVQSLYCDHCGKAVFDKGATAFTPVGLRQCTRCTKSVRSRGRLRNTIGNPLPAVLENLAQHAPRPSQAVLLDLLPEAP